MEINRIRFNINEKEFTKALEIINIDMEVLKKEVINIEVLYINGLPKAVLCYDDTDIVIQVITYKGSFTRKHKEQILYIEILEILNDYIKIRVHNKKRKEKYLDIRGEIC